MSTDIGALAMAHMRQGRHLLDGAGSILLPLARGAIATQLALPAQQAQDAP